MGSADAVVDGANDSIVPAPKSKKVQKKAADKKVPERWEDCVLPGEDITDPKVKIRCKDRYRKALAKSDFKMKKGTRYFHMLLMLLLVMLLL